VAWEGLYSYFYLASLLLFDQTVTSQQSEVDLEHRIERLSIIDIKAEPEACRLTDSSVFTG